MPLVRIAFSLAIFALPSASIADTVALAQPPNEPHPAACTLTMNFVPPAAPPASADAEPVIYVDSTQMYSIKSFTLKKTQKPSVASVATVTADLDLESTVATLLDEHAVIERAELACPSRIATLTNASIGYIGTSATSNAQRNATISFTMNYWPANLEIKH